MANYKLRTFEKGERTMTLSGAATSIGPLLKDEKKSIVIAIIAMAVNAAANLLSPYIISKAIDRYILSKDFHGVLVYSAILLGVFLVGLVASYLQTRVMGGVGRRVLYKLRNAIFTKLQALPVAFFNANKAGDLISRINNDTDKLNQFFSQALMQFVGNIFMMLGAGIFLLSLNIKLGVYTLLPALGVVILTRLFSGWLAGTSARSLRTTGLLSAEIQEALANFKVVVAFNRRDYFREKFAAANKENYTASIKAGVAANTLIPIYGIASNLGQLIVIAAGISMISSGQLTVGLLIGFFLYVNNFYMPLRQLASIWSTLQLAFASFDRISEVLDLEANITTIPTSSTAKNTSAVLSFEDVSFEYSDGKKVLHDVTFSLEHGKTYALVGPTGGGKTTTASLMARLYDPTEGTIFLDGKDIRSYEASERTQKVGFILQEPFLFTGTVRENILYGNDAYTDIETDKLEAILAEEGLTELLARFEQGLDTVVGAGDAISLGQKQLIAFVRAVLRRPSLLILDEATANIDTVTEQLLQKALDKLPKETTRVIIAHRLNTIKNADEIFFVNSGTVTQAGSFDHALELLMHGNRTS